MRNYQHNLSLSREQELVFWSIRVDDTQDERTRRLLDQKLDWSAVSQFAVHHNVIPLLYARLEKLGIDSIPNSALQDLMKLYRAITVQNLRKAEKLIQVISWLYSHGIETVALKGPALAVQVYGDLSMRRFVDLDILVKNNDFYPAYDLFKQEGYQESLPVKRQFEKFLANSGCDLHLIQQGYSIELHWSNQVNLTNAPIHSEDLWQNLDQVNLQNVDISVLPPETLLLFLCHHGCMHHWSRLQWIADVGYLLSKYPHIDLLALHDQARSIGMRREFELGSLLAERLTGVKLPEEFIKQINSDPTVVKLLQNIVDTSLKEEYLLNSFSTAVFNLRLKENFIDWLKLTGISIFIPRQLDWMVLDLPDFLYPLYYIIRPIRLLITIAKQSLRSIFARP